MVETVREHFEIQTACYKSMGGCYRHEHVHVDFKPHGTGKPLCMGGSGPPPAGGWNAPGSARLVAFKTELDRKAFPHVFHGSGFNCRVIKDTQTASQHAFWNALDIQSDDWVNRYKYLDPVWAWLNSPWGTPPPKFPGRLLKYMSPLMHGADVLQWKRQLIHLGYPGIDQTDIFGTGVRNATMAFQKKNSLAADGIVGPMTWAEGFKNN